MPKALDAKVVGRTEFAQLAQPVFGRGPISAHITQADPELIGAVHSALEFARMARGCKHAHALHRHRRPIRILAPRQVHAERLPGQRVPILEARETHGHGRNTGKARNLLRHPFGVRAAFFDGEQCMLATAIRSEAEHLINLEILGRLASRLAGRPPCA